MLLHLESVVWIPETDADRERVQQELTAILCSTHFRNSKRYPALLRYVVEKTLDGEAEALKERTLGVEVFERRPDYDTNADPVVRFSASEVRKRLAQYYHEAGGDQALEIELPLGSYVPEFRLRIEESKPDAGEAADGRSPVVQPEPSSASVSGSETGVTKSRRALFWAVLIGTALGGALAWSIYRAMHPDLIKAFWQPVVATRSPVLIVVGAGSLELTSPEPSQTSMYDHMVGPYDHISLSSAVAISRITNVVQGSGAGYVVKEARETTLTDLRGRSVILVGALNNAWALRLVAPLRYRFAAGPPAQIQDQRSVGETAWTVDFSRPFRSVQKDYAVVARYHDEATNGSVLMVAGLGSYGTEAASELISSRQYLQTMMELIAKDWKNKNVELVIETDVIDGEAGPPKLVSSTVW